MASSTQDYIMRGSTSQLPRAEISMSEEAYKKVPADTFQLFPFLPAELRQIVWKEALLPECKTAVYAHASGSWYPRKDELYQAKGVPDGQRFTDNIDQFQYLENSPQWYASRLRRVNIEAREVALKYECVDLTMLYFPSDPEDSISWYRSRNRTTGLNSNEPHLHDVPTVSGTLLYKYCPGSSSIGTCSYDPKVLSRAPIPTLEIENGVEVIGFNMSLWSGDPDSIWDEWFLAWLPSFRRLKRLVMVYNDSEPYNGSLRRR